MNGISTSLSVLIILGIPQGMLITLALHLFSGIRIQRRKYACLSVIFILSTYLIRFLPIPIGVNTVLSFLVVIVSFQLFYQYHLKTIIASVLSAVITLILIAVSEELNMLLLVGVYGQRKAEELFMSSSGLMGSLSGIPSNLFLAIFIFIGYQILKRIEKRKIRHGAVSESTVE